MSSRTWQERVKDILTCIDSIQSFANGMTLDQFADDAKTIKAIAFEFSTMGEAVRAIPLTVREQHPEIPWGQMLGLRNVVVHEYFRIDEEVLWHTIQNDLPPLIPLLETLLRQ